MDCQSLIRKLEKWDVLRTIHWIKGHPEHSHTPRLGWSQDQWGNYIADLYAGGPPRQATTFPDLTVSPTLPSHILARAAIRYTDWQFITNTHIPMLASPSQAISRASFADYLYNRDTFRTSSGAPPRWGTTTLPLAVQAWKLSARGIAQRGAKLRHLLDLLYVVTPHYSAAVDTEVVNRDVKSSPIAKLQRVSNSHSSGGWSQKIRLRSFDTKVALPNK